MVDFVSGRVVIDVALRKRGKYMDSNPCDGHYTTAVRVLSSFGVAPYNDATVEDLKAKHPLRYAPSLPHIPIDYHQLTSSHPIFLDMIKSFPRGTSCRRDGLCAQHPMDCLSGVAVAISDELFSSITQVVNLFLDGKCPKNVCLVLENQREAILNIVRLCYRNLVLDVLLSHVWSNFAIPPQPDSFNLLFQAWYLDDGTIIGDTLVVREVLKEIMKDRPLRGLHLNVDKIEVKEKQEKDKIRTKPDKNGKRRKAQHSASYQFFVDMLKHLDRDDLNQLWALVKESLSIKPPTSDKEMELWVELKRLYEPDDEGQLWTHTQNLMHAPVEWKLYDTCGVYHVTSKDTEIFMLMEKDYPFRKGLAIRMISYKLQVENYSKMANDLILKIYKIANSPRKQDD
nr:hypothetical protein [Tanacetum cinerariifolium]